MGHSKASWQTGIAVYRFAVLIFEGAAEVGHSNADVAVFSSRGAEVSSSTWSNIIRNALVRTLYAPFEILS